AVEILFRLLEQAQTIRSIGEISDLGSEELLARVIQSTRDAIVNALMPLAGEASVLEEFSQQTRSLLSDIVHPPVSGFDPISEAKRRFEAYQKGKEKRNAVCVICGAEATVRGVASLHGEGVESFNNFLPGGSDIGGDRKVFLCSACDLESKLRSVLLRGAETVILLIPQLQASWAVSEVWWNAAADYLSTLSGLAPPYDVGRLSEVLLQKGTGAWDDVYRGLARLVAAGRRGGPVRLLAEILAARYSDLSALSFAFGKSFQTHEEAARWVLENGALDELPDDVKDALREGGASRWAIGYASSNYLVVLTGSVGGDEPETARLIRVGFLALLLARALFATAVIPSIPLQVLGPELVPKGYGELPGKLLLREILWDTLGLETGWVPLERVDEVLVRLAALIRADSITRMYQFAGVPYGRDNLIQLARREPGQVLARAAGNMKGDHLRELARCLRIWWEGLDRQPGEGSASGDRSLALAGAHTASGEV
ncbi:MAG: hypothetical protein QI223_04515, partial [Candidatus Korarchaeota archaeon]|nr:hypothetical protein [Candidatus Korarchaeota archaeon]